MKYDHTPGPWTAKKDPCGGGFIHRFVGSDGQGLAYTVGLTERTDDANSALIVSAPDYFEMLRAIIMHGWEVSKISCYDEEGVEGWRWSTPAGEEYEDLGSWDELPPWPDSARDALAQLEGRR